MADNDFDAGFEKPKANMWKPGKPGNVIKGVMVGHKDFEGKYGPTTSYELKAIAGKYNDITQDDAGNDVVSEEETTIVAGETYIVMDRSTISDDIRKADVGQQILVRFVEMRKPKSGGKSYKYVECKLGPMDPDYVKAAQEKADKDFV